MIEGMLFHEENSFDTKILIQLYKTKKEKSTKSRKNTKKVQHITSKQVKNII